MISLTDFTQGFIAGFLYAIVLIICLWIYWFLGAFKK